MAAPSIQVEDLLAHDAWVRRMVRDLVEPDLVEDVVQETFLAAWLHGRIGNLPGFLRRVGRNLALRQRRQQGRRRRREQTAAREESLPATARMLERLEAHRQLTAAVGELQEPYRTAILLRYFEGRSAREIAGLQGVPASTVRTRLGRGLARLRGRLEDKDLRALAALFLWPVPGVTAPVPVVSKLAASLFAGVVFMSVHGKSTLFLGLLLLVLAGTGVWYWKPLGAGGAQEPAAGGALAQSRREPGGSAGPGNLGERQPLGPANPPDQATDSGAMLRGRVLDTHGVAMAGVPVLVDRKDPRVAGYDELLRVKRQQDPVLLVRTRTDREGRFRLPEARLPPDVEVDVRLGDGYLALWLSLPRREHWDRQEVLVVAAPETSLGGRVVDRDGGGIGGAIVAANVSGLVDFPFPLEDARAMSLGRTRTDARGRFSLSGLPDVPELELWVLATGYHPATVDRQDHRLILLQRERSRHAYHVHGTVLDRSLRAAEGALVRVGSRQTRSDDRGHFDLGFDRLDEDTHLLLAREGHFTTTWDRHLEPLRSGRQSEVVVTLILGGAPRQIAGRVVDEQGAAVAGLVVVLEDVVFLGFYQTGEDLALGRKSRLESTSGHPMKVDARTDADGVFQVGGLRPQAYRLHLFDPDTLVAVLTDPVAAGTRDLRVEFPRSAILPQLRGVVRSSAGRPLGDLEVKCALRTFRSETVQCWIPGDIARTRADGTFVLKDVPRLGVHLKVSGPEVMDHQVAVEDALSGREVVLVPPLRCHFRVRSAPPGADAIRLLDAGGKVLTIFRKTGQMSLRNETWTLRRGRTTTLAVSERVRTLVYLDGDEELARQPIRLEPGRINDLR